MKINAYILAADPAWIEASVLSYYDVVEQIIVSYDEQGRGFSGGQVQTEECLERLRAIDRAGKLVYSPGDFYRPNFGAMENETHQRQVALQQAGQDADWVLQLDTDEILPDVKNLKERLAHEVPAQYVAVDWPMRTFFQRTGPHSFLEVCDVMRRQISSYPGSIAVRPNVELHHARQTKLPCWRYDVRAKDTDPAAGNRTVHAVLSDDQALIHFSWVRSQEEITKKLQSWGHSGDFDWQSYLRDKWQAAPKRWRWMFRLHPLVPRWWPALRRVTLKEDILNGYQQ